MFRSRHVLFPSRLVWLLSGGMWFAGAAGAWAEVDFVREVAPIFREHCVACHGPEKQKSGYRLDVRESALRGGDLGEAPIVPGDGARSPLVRFVSGADADFFMPPGKSDLAPLSAAQVATLRAWIDEGAVWPEEASAKVEDRRDWWSLKPIARPEPPGAGHPIDAFIEAKLAERGLWRSPEADRRTLIRRLFFDLVGLPPEPEEVEAFVADEDPQAYEKLAERLLGSPRYGERWARHWLDVVHFGETHGYDKDQPRSNAWPYRDYVVRAFNEDKPYARFVEEQIAGDVLFPGTTDGVEALGFISAGPWDLIGHAELPESKIDGKIARHLDRDDMVSNTMSSFASVTVHCAQCHDHKFDPVSQEDYYRLQAVFSALDRADRKYDADPVIAAQRAELERKQGKGASEEESKELEAALKKLPPRRVAYVGTVHHGSGNFSGTGAAGGKPRAIHLLARGDVTKPGREIGPGALSAIAALPGRFDFAETDGERRAALAKWLTDQRNPLTWRSLVNRVWQYHFGRGLVETANDFGRMGELPTHPELLDYLASEFRDGGGSMKALHRLIVTSATYRQVSATRTDAALQDSGNALLWRQNRRKLEAEAIRDSLLAVAGKLDLEMGGPSFQDFVIEKPEHSPHYRYDLADPESPKFHRRSIYRFLVRSQQQPFMAALDCADPSMLVEKRNETLTPLQALAQLNNQLALAMAKHFAARVERSGTTREAQVTQAFRLALARSPTGEELGALTEFAREHGLANTCRAIMNLNEFVFID